MGAQRIQYSIVGRYINADDARDVVGYHMKSLDGSKQGRYSIEQVAFLVGRGQVINCSAQIYKDKMLFRGVGMPLDSLPSMRVKVNKPDKNANDNSKGASKPESAAKIEQDKPESAAKPVKLETGGDIFAAIKNAITTLNLGKPNDMDIKFGKTTQQPYFKLALDIPVSEDSSDRSHFEFVIDASQNDYYYLRDVDHMNEYIVRNARSAGIKEFIAVAGQFIGILRKDAYTRIPSLHNDINSIYDAFEAYSGNSCQVECPLRGQFGSKNGVANYLLPVGFIQNLIMIMKYHSIKSSGNLKLPLFRGERSSISEISSRSKCVPNFMSFSYCAAVAAGFSGGGSILYVEEAPINLLLGVEEIAVMPGEFEVLVNMGVGLEVGEQVGKLLGASIYKVKLKQVWGYKECVQHMVKMYSDTIKNSIIMYTVYKLAMCTKHPKQFEFTGQGYSGVNIYSFNDIKRYIHINLDLVEVGSESSCEVDIDGTRRVSITNRSQVDDLVKHIHG